MGASQTTELQVFGGGVILQPAPHLLQPDQERYLANANLRKGNLATLPAPLFVEEGSGSYAFYFAQAWHYYDSYRSNVLYNGVWYWSSRFDSGKMYSDGTELPLGIEPPQNRLTTSATAPSEGDGISGKINYVYTYYDPISGSESPPSKPSLELEVDKQAISITGIASSPEGYQIRLYRIGGIITAYTAVVTLPDTSTDYLDELHFSEMQAIILDTLRAYPPSPSLHYLTQHQGRFYGAVNSRLFFSAPGKPDSWYNLDFLGFDTVIKGIASTSNGLIVMTDVRSWVITGLTPLQFTKHLLSDSEGCVSEKSIATNDGTAIWLSNSGFVMSNGGSVQNISINALGRFVNVTPRGAAVIDKRYFMSFGGALYPSPTLFPSPLLLPGAAIASDTTSIPSGAIVIDFSTGQPKFSTIIDEKMNDLIVHANYLYHISATETEPMNIVLEDGSANITGELGRNNIVADTASDIALVQTITGSDTRELRYASPLLTEQSIGMLKQYEKVRVTYVGSLHLIIRNDSGRILQEVDLSSLVKVSEWVGIPVAFNRGYGIQFSIVGQCVVDSLMYNWTPKEVQ